MAGGRVFYGWWVTIVFAVMVFLSTGVRFSVGPFLKPMVFVVHRGGAALGSWLGGFLFELTAGYGAAFVIASVQLLVAAGVSLTLDERARCVPRLRPVAAGR